MSWNLWNQCKRKKRYRDEYQASYYCKLFWKERGTKLDFYWCRYCEGFHLTSSTDTPDYIARLYDPALMP